MRHLKKMSDEIFFDGVRYVSAGEAGNSVGFTRDYVARLCKESKLRGKRVGKQWYVSPAEVKDFAIRQEYTRAKRSEELAQARKSEYQNGGRHVVHEDPPVTIRPTHSHGSIQEAFQSVVSRVPHQVSLRSAQVLTSAPLHAASLKAHAGAQVFPPALELLHKFIAITIAVLFTAGTFVLVDAQYARVAERSTSGTAAIARAVHHTLVAAASNPADTFSQTFQNFAKAFNTKIDSLVYGIMFPRSLAEDSRAKVVARVLPRQTQVARTENYSTSNTYVPQPVVERIVSSAGGITEEILNAKLAELHESLVDRKLFKNQTAGTNSSIEDLASEFSESFETVDLTVSDTATLATLSAGTSTLTALNVDGSATSTFANGIDLTDGCFAINGTCISGSGGGGGTIDGSGSANLFAYFTDADTLAATSSPTVGYLVATSTTATSTFAAGVQTTYLNVTGTSATSTFASGLNLTSGCVAINGTCITGSSGSSASSTLLADSNTFSGANTFSQTITGSVTGNAGTATILQTARNINGVSFNGSADITVTAASSTLLANNNTWTGANIFGAITFTTATGTSATTTNLAVTSVTSAIPLAAADGSFAEYQGSTCTNQFVRSLNGAGVATCASVQDEDLNLSDITLTDFTNDAGFTTFTYPFALAGNATSTLTQFNGGLTAYASTTIGTGTQANGLTISGGATTTGYLVVQGSATSTYTGALAVQTNKLVVQSSSGRVGIGTASPTTGLDIDVATDISGDLTLSGGGALTISATGPINQTGTGQVTFSGNIDATNGLDVTNSNFTVGGNNFIVAPATGNTTIAGTLGLTGAFAASSTMQTTGASRFYSTLRVDNTLTAAGSGTGLSVTNNTSIGGTLALTGAATFGSTLDVTGALTAATTTLSGELALNTKKITGVATPNAASDAANKSYVDSVAQGLDLKESVRAGTTANITLSGEQSVDGVSLIAGDRVLVKDQADETKNGIYTVASGSWSRSTDADTDAEVGSGLFTFVSEGTVNANSGWVLTTPDPITLGTSLLVFTQFSGAGQITAGSGLTKSGNTLDVGGTANRITVNADSIDISSNYVGQTSITTVGTLTSGSLGSGFGNINIGASSITAGQATFSSIVGSAITGSGNLTVNGTGNFTGDVTINGELEAATSTFLGNISLSGKKITGLADPTSAQEAATKAYVDAIAQGLTVKASVRAATTTNITLSGAQTIDGISAIAGDRVLVMGQTNAAENGIYVVAAGAWSRSSDANENSEVVTGMYTFVEEGTNNANTGWSLITSGSITLGTTDLTFTQFSGSAEVTAGDGLTKTGNTINTIGTADRISVTADSIDIASTYAGQSSITTVGALTSGSIGSGFGAINIGSAALTAGTSVFQSATSYGTLSIGGTATTSIVGNSATSTFSGGISLASGNVNLATGGSLLLNNALLLNATRLGSSVVNSSLTSVGALDSGSITTGFGAINIGADTLDAGAATFSSLTVPYASTTAFTVSGTGYFGTASTTNLTVSSVPSALLVTNAGGAVSAFSGTSCTSQFIRSLNGAGVATCASVQDEDLNLSDITLSDFTNDADFVTWTSATSSLWRSSGLLSTASSTIGGGAQATGLTISGGATTTGFLVVQGSATSTFTAGLQSAYLNITGTNATSTFARGIDLAAGCFSIAGTCLSTSGGSGDITAVGNISTGDAFTSGTPGGELYFADNGFLGLGSGAGRIEFDDLTIDEVNILGANVGIGTSTPWALLSVNPNGATGPAFVVGSSTATHLIVTNGGNVGIGTTSPYRKFSLADAVSTAQVSIAYDTSRYTELLTNSVGDLTVNPQGDDAFFNDDNLWVCTGGSCPSNNPTGTGNLVVENKAGIGTTTPDSKLVIETQDATTDFLRVASSTAQSLLIFDERGYLGIGTSTPTQQLSIANKLFVGNGAPSSAGTATSTFMGDVLITGKLDVSTIDPVYTIDGVKYATYGHSTVGVKEEAIAIVGVTKKSWLFGKYEYTIDFDELEEGSDLWLFYQVSDFGAGWNNLAVTATAGFDGTVSYKKDDKENTLTLISSAPGEVSLRLIADRFDAEEWPNLRPDQQEGFPGFEISAKK